MSESSKKSDKRNEKVIISNKSLILKKIKLDIFFVQASLESWFIKRPKDSSIPNQSITLNEQQSEVNKTLDLEQPSISSEQSNLEPVKSVVDKSSECNIT